MGQLKDYLEKVANDQFMEKIAYYGETWADFPEVRSALCEVYEQVKTASDAGEVGPMAPADMLDLAANIVYEQYIKEASEASEDEDADEQDDSSVDESEGGQFKLATDSLSDEEMAEIGYFLGSLGFSPEYVEKVASADATEQDIVDFNELLLEAHAILAEAKAEEA